MHAELECVSEGDFDETLTAGTPLLNGQYRIDRYLSSGGFGITYLAKDSLDRTVVIKECFPAAFCSRVNKTVQARSRASNDDYRSFVALFVREARRLAKISHPNVVGVHQVFEDNETAYMALDLIDGKDLLDIIEDDHRRLSPPEVKHILLKILDAVTVVHEQDMLHRDISPDNILIDQDGNPILIDFGAAREEASKKSRALSAVLVVKDGYSPQEFYIAGSQQKPCSDLYALGATFFHLITGCAPPNSQSRLAAIAENKPDPCEPLEGRIEGYPPEFLAAIDTAMNVFPSDRIQTANDWANLIDSEKRREQSLSNAQLDLELNKRLSELVKSENAEAQKRASTKPSGGTATNGTTPKQKRSLKQNQRKAPSDSQKGQANNAQPKDAAKKEPTIAELRKRANTSVPVTREVTDYIQLVRQAGAFAEEVIAAQSPPEKTVEVIDLEKVCKHLLAFLIISMALFFFLFGDVQAFGLFWK